MLREFLIPRKIWAPRDADWWVAFTFIVGSVLFALGAILPALPTVPNSWVSRIFFAGSTLYLLGASVEVIKAVRSDRTIQLHHRGTNPAVRKFAQRNALAAGIQALGAVLFQTSMTSALIGRLGIGIQEALIWTPDLIGALCFVTASCIFFSLRYPIQHRRDNPTDGKFLAALNIAGSTLFVASAVGAFISPLTGAEVYPLVANAGTLLGAIFFFTSSIPGLPPKDLNTLRA